MVNISEITSDDGSNGGDPNKKPQEEDNQNENAIQQQVLYSLIGFPPFESPRLYILHRINNSFRLSLIVSLRPSISGSAVVTIGHDMYIFGGGNPPYPPVRIVFVIDCRFHTQRRLPDMRRNRYHAAAGVIDGKIYVIGGCIRQGGDWIEVFDVTTQRWVYEAVHGGPNYPIIASFDGVFGESVVMEDKIYILDRMSCLVYEPRRRRWKSWGDENLLRLFWNGSCCVIDDMLYTIDPMSILGYPILVFDPKGRDWRTVKGVQRYELFNFGNCSHYKVATLGGRLVILGRYASMYGWDYCYNMDRDIWCIVIALEKRDDGEIWGYVESKSQVLSCFKLPWIEHSRTVTV